MGDFYDKYIVSEAWRIKCKAAKKRVSNKCQLCAKKDNLTVHHNEYKHLGDEPWEDLVVLCEVCHEVFHAKCDKRTMEKYKDEDWVKRWKDVDYFALPDPPSTEVGFTNKPSWKNLKIGTPAVFQITPERREYFRSKYLANERMGYRKLAKQECVNPYDMKKILTDLIKARAKAKKIRLIGELPYRSKSKKMHSSNLIARSEAMLERQRIRLLKLHRR